MLLYYKYRICGKIYKAHFCRIGQHDYSLFIPIGCYCARITIWLICTVILSWSIPRLLPVLFQTDKIQDAHYFILNLKTRNILKGKNRWFSWAEISSWLVFFVAFTVYEVCKVPKPTFYSNFPCGQGFFLNQNNSAGLMKILCYFTRELNVQCRNNCIKIL